MPDRTVMTQNPTSTEGDRIEKLDVSLVILPLEFSHQRRESVDRQTEAADRSGFFVC